MGMIRRPAKAGRQPRVVGWVLCNTPVSIAGVALVLVIVIFTCAGMDPTPLLGQHGSPERPFWIAKDVILYPFVLAGL